MPPWEVTSRSPTAARKQRDRSHPLGYGMETYFWSFIVAVMVMLASGVVSIYQGVHRRESICAASSRPRRLRSLQEGTQRQPVRPRQDS
jgi:divalent metal cation (Fe/Co/Zn/Cd) transporter